MSSEQHVDNSVDYIEIPTTDLAASKRFWAQAFGWGVQDYGPAYVGLSLGGREHGGLRAESAVVSGGALVILYAADLERSLEAVTAAGAVITRAIFSFPGGRRFHFREPGGCELAVWTPQS